MAKKAETVFVEEIVEAAEALGAKTIKIHGHAMQAAGWPDLQIYHPRWTGHIEAKVDDNRCSTIQKLTIQDLVKLNTNALVLRLVDDAVLAETADCVLLARISKACWRVKHGRDRGHALFELLCLATEQMKRDADGAEWAQSIEDGEKQQS